LFLLPFGYKAELGVGAVKQALPEQGGMMYYTKEYPLFPQSKSALYALTADLKYP
jgi:hypothetical protein